MSEKDKTVAESEPKLTAAKSAAAGKETDSLPARLSADKDARNASVQQSAEKDADSAAAQLSAEDDADSISEQQPADEHQAYLNVLKAAEEAERKRNSYKKYGPAVIIGSGIIFLALMFSLDSKIDLLILWVASVLLCAALMIRAEYHFHRFRVILGLEKEIGEAEESDDVETDAAEDAADSAGEADAAESAADQTTAEEDTTE